jgi:hypothetical protein
VGHAGDVADVLHVVSDVLGGAWRWWVAAHELGEHRCHGGVVAHVDPAAARDAQRRQVPVRDALVDEHPGEGHHAHPAVAGEPAQDLIGHVAGDVADRAGRAVAEDHRRGADVQRLMHHRGPVRIDATLLAALTERAERDHVSRSEAIRATIRSCVA